MKKVKNSDMPRINRTVSTDGVLVVPARRCGNTTRIVDKVIQDLFAGKLCRIVDHHPTEMMARFTFAIIMERLAREHKYVFETSLCINEEMNCIWLDQKALIKLHDE